MFSFAGFALADPMNGEESDSPDKGELTRVAEWIDSNIRPSELFPLAYRAWPGSLTGPILDGIAEVPRPVRIGTLFWPWGASRFARAHFVVSEAQLASIRGAVSVAGVLKTGVLSLADGTNTFNTSMWMLPAWPLQTIAGAGMFLLTLVDDRYWWWQTPVLLNVVAGTTAWTDLYATIGTAIGATITVDTVASGYGTPPLGYSSSYRPAAAVLDAVAFSVGQRIVRDPVTGAVKAQNATTALASASAQYASTTALYAGGRLALVPG